MEGDRGDAGRAGQAQRNEMHGRGERGVRASAVAHENGAGAEHRDGEEVPARSGRPNASTSAVLLTYSRPTQVQLAGAAGGDAVRVDERAEQDGRASTGCSAKCMLNRVSAPRMAESGVLVDPCYGIASREAHRDGTPHWHVFLCFSESVRFTRADCAGLFDTWIDFGGSPHCLEGAVCQPADVEGEAAGGEAGGGRGPGGSWCRVHPNTRFVRRTVRDYAAVKRYVGKHGDTAEFGIYPFSAKAKEDRAASDWGPVYAIAKDASTEAEFIGRISGEQPWALGRYQNCKAIFNAVHRVRADVQAPLFQEFNAEGERVRERLRAWYLSVKDRRGDKSIFILVGRTKLGKTCLIQHWAAEVAAEGYVMETAGDWDARAFGTPAKLRIVHDPNSRFLDKAPLRQITQTGQRCTLRGFFFNGFCIGAPLLLTMNEGAYEVWRAEQQQWWADWGEENCITEHVTERLY